MMSLPVCSISRRRTLLHASRSPQVLNDATEKVKEKSCYALEAFSENLGELHKSLNAFKTYGLGDDLSKLCFNS